MKITSDWHIHSNYSCDAASLEMADLVAEAADTGIDTYGITDHLHTPYNLPDVQASRKEYEKFSEVGGFHFGIEVSCVSQWELDRIANGEADNPVYGIRKGGPAGAAPALGIDQNGLADLGVEFVVAGTHWPLYVALDSSALIRDYHRQNMFLAEHPLVDVVAHPWWWMGHWMDADQVYRGDPWIGNFGVIPKSMHNEFAAAVVEFDTLVEINLSAMLLTTHYPDRFKTDYLGYLVSLKDLGVKFSIGSDCHNEHYTEIDFTTAQSILDSVGITEEDLGPMPPRR
jgi:histidinol phosphatase-like PHP family hydrolase